MEMEVLERSLHGIFSRGLRATSLIGAKWVVSELPCTLLLEVEESEV